MSVLDHCTAKLLQYKYGRTTLMIKTHMVRAQNLRNSVTNKCSLLFGVGGIKLLK